jgi:hypothetical protein
MKPWAFVPQVDLRGVFDSSSISLASKTKSG